MVGIVVCFQSTHNVLRATENEGAFCMNSSKRTYILCKIIAVAGDVLQRIIFNRIFRSVFTIFIKMGSKYRIILRQFVLLSTVLILIASSAAQQQVNKVATDNITYRCPPCGCEHDSLTFNLKGSCSNCNMELVTTPKGAVAKIDKHLAPFLWAGMLGQFYTKVIYPVFAIGIFLPLFLLLKRLKGKSLNIFLTGIILTLSLYAFKNQLFAVNYSLTDSYKSLFTPISFILMLGPLLFFYIKSLITSAFKWQIKYWWHMFPGILMFSYYSALTILPESVKLKFMFSPFEVSFSHTEQILTVVLGLYYLGLSYTTFKQWKNRTAVRSTKLSSWVFRFLIGMFGLFIVWGCMIIANFWIYNFGVATVSYNPLWLAIALVLLWLGIEIIANLKFFLLNKKIQPVNGNATITDKDLSHLKLKLEQLMSEKKLYTNPDLSLDSLALALEINPKYLSVILNNSVGKNFYDFINHYRIEEVKERLADSKSRNYTIEAIANQAGFRSKSSFNAAFKKQVNMTPREFIREENNK